MRATANAKCDSVASAPPRQTSAEKSALMDTAQKEALRPNLVESRNESVLIARDFHNQRPLNLPQSIREPEEQPVFNMPVLT